MHPDNNSKIPTPETVTIKKVNSSDFIVDDITDAASPSSLMKQATAAYEEFLQKRFNNICDARIAEKHEEEEWIWVDGYKGTSADMTAYDNFQYKLNEMYAKDDDVEIEACKNGFHFCRDLKDVFEYCSINKSNRFFKVRALVRKKDYEKYDTVVQCTGLFGRYRERVNKLAAKKIILERELTADEIFFEDKYADWTEDEKKLALKEGCETVIKNRNVAKLVEAGYSETFAAYVAESDGKTKTALAVASQPGLSMDMKVFTIMYND